jgi:hypothetical protein
VRQGLLGVVLPDYGGSKTLGIKVPKLSLCNLAPQVELIVALLPRTFFAVSKFIGFQVVQNYQKDYSKERAD